jgi:hypothetical protein
MNCRSYLKLSDEQKREFAGKLIHVVASDELAFRVAQKIIEAGSEILENIKIGNEIYQSVAVED